MSQNSFDFTPHWFLTGPTASGKTAVGVELARLIDAEIISLDSMAVYREMDIGTAKPTAAERAAVPHHLIDVVDPHEDFSVAQYRDAAARVAGEIAARGKHVLFVGGTPLYLKALLRGLFEGPKADWKLRHQLEAEEITHGIGWLHRKLVAVDPPSAERLHRQDSRRLIRALEVYELTGKPISHWQQQSAQPVAAPRVFTLAWPKEALVQRIDTRVDGMFAAGFVDECRRLAERSSPLSRTAGQALGYREVFEHLNGQPNLAETIELVKLHTRQFAKRQMTWFRGLKECQFVALAEPLDATAVARQLHIQARSASE